MKKIFLLLSFLGIGVWGFSQTVTTTTPASNITYNSADISGTVDTLGVKESDVDVYLAWRTSAISSGPGGGTPAGSWNYSGAYSITGSGTQTYSKSLTDLDENKSYDYYIMLWNNNTNASAGDGSIEDFSTYQKPTASAASAASITQTSATITGGGNAKGSTYNTSIGYRKDGDPTYTYLAGSPSSISGSSQTSFTLDLTGLSANTKYYIVSALFDQNTGDKIVSSGASDFTTSNPTKPTVTTGSIESITTTTFKVDDSEVSDDGGADIDDYGVYVDANNPPTTKDQTGTNGATPLVYDNIFTGGSAGHTYYAQAYAHNSKGETKDAVRTIKTVCDAPVSKAATDVVDVSFTANWNSTYGAQTYQLDVSDDNFSSSIAGYPKDVGNVTSYSVGSLTAGTDYKYRVAAKNDGGDGDNTVSANSSDISVHTVAAAPTQQAENLTWKKLSSTSMRIFWDDGNGDGRLIVMKEGSAVADPTNGVEYDASTTFESGDPVGGDADSYAVYNGSSKTKQVDVTNLSDGPTYYIKVNEYKGNGSDRSYNTTSSDENNGNTTLPVSLISFKASALENNVLINWETATEENNDYFLIERSLDAEKFEAIAKIEGSGNSNVLLSYDFVDTKSPSGVVYYRLIQFDYDGAKTVFNLVSINMSKEDNSIETVYVDNNTVSIDLNTYSSKSTVSLVDVNGKTTQAALISQEGRNTIKFDMKSLSNGVYFIVVEDGEKIASRKFIF